MARGAAMGRRVMDVGGLEMLSSESLLGRLSHCLILPLTSLDLLPSCCCCCSFEDAPRPDFAAHELLVSTSESDVMGLPTLRCSSVDICCPFSLWYDCGSIFKYSWSSVSESTEVMRKVGLSAGAFFVWWTSAPLGANLGAPESAASSDILRCPGRFGLTFTGDCVGVVCSESFLPTALCLVGEVPKTLTGSVFSSDNFLAWDDGMGEGDSSLMAWVASPN